MHVMQKNALRGIYVRRAFFYITSTTLCEPMGKEAESGRSVEQIPASAKVFSGMFLYHRSLAVASELTVSSTTDSSKLSA